MNKSVAIPFAAIVVALLGALPVFAQTTYTYSMYGVSYPTYTSSYAPAECTVLSHYLEKGSRDSGTNDEVSKLQRFLVSKNYPGGGTWMITGYFGDATEQAVKNFQLDANISRTGTVGSQTRTAIQNETCGTSYIYDSSYSYGYTPYSYSYSTTYPYVTPYYQTYIPTAADQGIAITSLSPTFGAVGDRISVQGYGFSRSGNAVHFGNGVIANLISIDGNSLSFEVPSELRGFGNRAIELATYNVSVVNGDGEKSNSLPFTVTSLTRESATPTILSVTGPSVINAGEISNWSISWRAASGTYVTTTVKWGDGSGNTVRTAQASGSSSQTQSFAHIYSIAGTYTLTFEMRGSSGEVRTRTMTISVTGSGSGGGTGDVSLWTISPTQGQAGVQILIQGDGFTPSDNTVHFGIGGTRNLSSTGGGTKIYYTIPHFISACDLIVGPCSAPAIEVTSGAYPIYVTNSSGSTNTLNFTVSQ